MLVFSQAVIIFNPNSTGDSPALAEQLVKDIRNRFPQTDVVLKGTQHAGHAETLAYEAARSKPDTLIISVSGDGGYHEVVNGAMRATNEGGCNPICAVVPGGNANDHYASVHYRPLIEALEEGTLERLDLISVKADGKLRYAHSYVGLGLTPLVATELNRYSLTALKETWLAFKTFWKFKPFQMQVDGKLCSFDSFIVTNIETMAKHLKLAPGSSPKDGQFEIITWPHHQKWRLVARILQAVFGGNKKVITDQHVTLKTLAPMPMQLDGEVHALEPDTTLEITIERLKLRTIR